MGFVDWGVTPPAGLRTDAFLLRPIVADDAELDYAAVMETKEFLRLWEPGGWPEDDFTLAANRGDLAKMEERHRAGYAFGYTMMNLDETECLGCVYVMPSDAKMYAEVTVDAVGDRRWTDMKATVFFWVRHSRLDGGLEERLLAELRRWFGNDWGLAGHVYSTNERCERQVNLIESAGLTRQFELDTGDPGLTVAYA